MRGAKLAIATMSPSRRPVNVGQDAWGQRSNVVTGFNIGAFQQLWRYADAFF